MKWLRFNDVLKLIINIRLVSKFCKKVFGDTLHRSEWETTNEIKILIGTT